MKQIPLVWSDPSYIYITHLSAFQFKIHFKCFEETGDLGQRGGRHGANAAPANSNIIECNNVMSSLPLPKGCPSFPTGLLLN